MVLILTPTTGERKFWVTRRLWLALLHEISGLVPAASEDKPSDVPPANRPSPLSAEDAAGLVMLETVQFTKPEDGVTVLVFQSKAEPISMSFKEPGLVQFKRMLETQADRSGWDAPAAMHRLRAGAIAGAAVRRAGK